MKGSQGVRNGIDALNARVSYDVVAAGASTRGEVRRGSAREALAMLAVEGGAGRSACEISSDGVAGSRDAPETPLSRAAAVCAMAAWIAAASGE